MTTQSEKYQPLMDDGAGKAKSAKLARIPTSMRYDPLQCPPSFPIAEGHLLATRIAAPIPNETAILDQASGLPTNNKEFSMFDSTQRMSFIAPAFPMFFQFRKFCLIIGFTILLCSGLHNMISNYRGNVCSGNGLERTGTIESSEPSTDHSYSTSPEDQVFEFISAKSGYTYMKNEFEFLKPGEKNIQGHMDQCQNNTVNLLSAANRLNNPVSLNQTDIYNFFTILVIGLLMQILRKIQKQTAQVADERAITASDYTIRVSNIPQNFDENVDIDEEIRNFFISNGVQGRKMNVQNVSVCYDVREKINVTNKLKQISTNRSKLLARKRNGELISDDDIRKLENEMEALKQKRDAISQRFKEGVGVSKYFTGEAYVTFETQHELQDVLRNWHFTTHRKFLETMNKASAYKFKGNLLNVSQAPEPSDVFWENAGSSYTTKLSLKLITNVVTAVLLAIGFYVIFAIQKKKLGMLNDLNQKAASQEEKDFVVTVQVKAVSMGASCFIVIVNMILKTVMLFFTKREKFSTYTEFQSTYAIRLALAQFFNTAVVTFLVYIYFENIAGPGGLIYTAFWIFLSDAAVTWGFTLFNPTYFMHLFKKWQTSKTKDPIMTQEELNTVYELPPFDFCSKYAAVAKTLLSAAFFAPLIPPVSAVAIVTIGVDYWFDKYVILRRSSRGRGTGPELSFDFIEFLEYCLVFFSIGNFIFHIYILGENVSDEFLTLIGLCIGLANAFLPMAEINENMFPARDEILTNEKYSELRYTLQEDYDRSNPATEDIATANYIEEKERRQATGAV